MQQKPNGSDSDFSFAIKRHIGVLSTTPRGWTKELNLVSYNGGRSKLDIRLWSEDHQKMGKGITLVREEADILYALLTNIKKSQCGGSGKKS